MQKVRDHCHYTGKYRGAAHSNCNLNYKIPKEIPVVFHNGSKYGYHFIIKQSAREFKGNFECLGENTEKYFTFSVPIKKEQLLLLRKVVYSYEYMDKWKRFKDDKLPDKESFYSELNNEHITDDDYAHAQKVCDIFNIKNLGEYHDLYVQSDTAQLADVFENFRKTC